MRRAIYTCILVAFISGCGLTQSDFEKLYGVGGEEQEVLSPSISSVDPSPTPLPTCIPEQPEPEEEPEPEKKPGRCRDSGKLVVGHNHECIVGNASRGGEVLKFTGSRGGLEALKSNTTGELKLGLPWNYSCSLAKSVKVCGPKGCKSAQNNRTAWVNYDSTPQGNMCTQWARWGEGNTPSKIFKEVGAKGPKGVYFLVDGKRVDLCIKQWKKEQRCS